MQTFTATQRRLLDARDDEVKMALEIDDSPALRYCTGADPIEIDSDWYDPHGMRFNKIALTDPRTSRTVVSLADPEEDGFPIRTQWYSTKLDATAIVYWFLRDADGTWEEVLTVEWSVEDCNFDRKGNFRVSLSAAAGSRPRAGGAIGTHSEFPMAPLPGEAWRLGHAGITFRSGVGMPPPPPGGWEKSYEQFNRPPPGGSGPRIPRAPSGGSGNQANPGGGTTSSTS
jgi:hypothetical protein